MICYSGKGKTILFISEKNFSKRKITKKSD